MKATQKKLDFPPARKLYADDCPVKYTGPIEAANGARPYNGNLWRDEWWWANREMGNRHSSRFHFGIVHLAPGVAPGGDFAVDGMVWMIEANSRRYSWNVKPDDLPRPNNFPTRTAAIRVAAADLLRLARAARQWRQANYNDSLHDPIKFAEIVNWVRAVVARETEAGEPRVMVAKPLPPPPPEPTGMPILDFIHGCAA